MRRTHDMTSLRNRRTWRSTSAENASTAECVKKGTKGRSSLSARTCGEASALPTAIVSSFAMSRTRLSIMAA